MIDEPEVTVKSATVGEIEEQKDCAEAVGAEGVGAFSTKTMSSKFIRCAPDLLTILNLNVPHQSIVKDWDVKVVEEVVTSALTYASQELHALLDTSNRQVELASVP